MSFLLTILLRGLVLGGVGLLALALLRRSSAATRAAVATVFLGALLALPLGLISAPRRVLPPRPSAVQRIVSERLTVLPPPSPISTTIVEPAASPPSEASRAIPTGAVVLAVWAVGAMGLILRTLLGWSLAIGWARRSTALPPEATGLKVRLSKETTVPCAFWAGRSTILLPQSSTEWDEDRRRAVLLHEAAHIRRGDWAALILSRFALAFHWPNPFAWLLARSLRRAAEDAADDAVLRAGFIPTSYADHLLALAPRRRSAALVLTMATKSDIDRRIRLVLHPYRTRGSASFATLAFASLIVGGLFIPLTSFAVGQHRHLKSASPAESSSYIDIRSGKTKPGTPSNGFIGHFADGTTAQVVQISMRTPRGIRAWKPSGEMIPASRRRNVQHLGPHYRSILVRYPYRTTQADGGLGSGPRTSTGEPSVLGFNSSRNQPGPTAKTWESYQFVEVPREDGDRSSFTFGLSNEPWRSFTLPGGPGYGSDSHLTVPSTVGSRKSPFSLRNFGVARGTVHPVLRGANGLYLRDRKGIPLRGNAPATTVTFSPPDDKREYVAEIKAILRNGQRGKPFWNDNARHGDDFVFRYHFRQKSDEIREFHVRMRSYKNVEFHEVRLKPNPL